MINVLVICDDFWHPGEIFEWGLKPLEGNEFHLTFIKDAKDMLTPAFLKDYTVIMCCKGNSINGANHNKWFEEGIAECLPRDLEAYVKAGGGYLSVHASNTSREGDEYTSFVGNFFKGHPPRCPVDVVITKQHPVTKGVENFTIRDEHYNIQVVAEDADIFCKTISESGGEQVGGYSRNIGDGRLCVLTPGHILDVFRAEGYQKMLANAIRWCAKVK